MALRLLFHIIFKIFGYGHVAKAIKPDIFWFYLKFRLVILVNSKFQLVEFHEMSILRTEKKVRCSLLFGCLNEILASIKYYLSHFKTRNRNSAYYIST